MPRARSGNRNATDIDVCIDGFMNWILTERGLSQNTIAAYERDLRAFVDYIRGKKITDVGEISQSVVVGFLRKLTDRGLAAKTISRNMSSIRGFFRYLMLEGKLERDPTEAVDLPKLPKPLPDIISVEQVEKIMDAVDLDFHRGLGIRDRAVLETLYATGVRESEIIDLKTQDVYEDIGFVRVFGKGSKERLVPINENALYWIDRYKRDIRPKLMSNKRTPILFLTGRGNRLSRMGLYNIVSRWSEKAGLPEVHPHTFRHAFATHLIEGGADLRAVQEMLGHEDISTTQIYTNIGRKHLHEVYRKFHPRGA